MDAPRLIAGTALVCLAAIAVAPRGGEAWPASTSANIQQQSDQSRASKQVEYTQTRPFQWSTFGLFPSGAAQANAQLVPTNPQQVVINEQRFRRQASSNSTNKRKKPTKKNSKALIAECLAAHNKMRRLHNVPDLQWDDKLAAFAQKRSNHIAASDGAEFGHPPDLPFGENLFWHSSLEKGCEYMVKGWYDEIDLYDFKAPTFAPATGHFTQMVWKGTQKVGCAFAPSSGPRGGLYLTCNYDPPGNWVGEFEENVPLPKGVGSGAPATTTSTTTTTTTSTTTTPRPATSTTLAPTSGAPAVSDKPATETTKPKSKKKKNRKGKKKGDKEKKKGQKRKGKKKKKSTTTTTTTSTTPPPATSTTKPISNGQ